MRGEPTRLKPHPLALLETGAANGLIDAVNALVERKVMVAAADGAPSAQLVGPDNSLLYVTRADLVQKAKLRNHPVYTDGRACTGGAVGEIYLGTSPPQVNTPDGCQPASGILVKAPNPQPPSQGQSSAWYPTTGILQKGPGGWSYLSGPAARLHCRSKAGTAILCGFAELSAPSIPPKAYKISQYSGSIADKVFNNSSCDDGGQSGGGSGDLVLPNLIYNYLGVNYTATGVLHWTHTDATHVRFTATTTDGGGGQSIYINGHLTINNFGAAVNFSVGPSKPAFFDIDLTTYTLEFPVQVRATVSWFFGDGSLSAWATVASSLNYCITDREDNWSYLTDDYSPGLPAACTVTETDTRATTINGVPASLPAVPPNSQYGAFVTKADDSPTQARWVGTNVCASIGSGQYRKVSGTVTRQLSSEDTAADAIARALAGVGWTDPGLCSSYDQTRGAGEFSFGCQVAEVAADLSGLTIGNDYIVTIALGNRPLGVGQFMPIGDSIVISLTAGAESETTPFQALPSPNSGEEIAAISVTISPA